MISTVITCGVHARVKTGPRHLLPSRPPELEVHRICVKSTPDSFHLPTDTGGFEVSFSRQSLHMPLILAQFLQSCLGPVSKTLEESIRIFAPPFSECEPQIPSIFPHQKDFLQTWCLLLDGLCKCIKSVRLRNAPPPGHNKSDPDTTHKYPKMHQDKNWEDVTGGFCRSL